MGSLLLTLIYMGYLTMPTLFGLIAGYISISLLPVFVLGLLLLVTVMHELVAKKDNSQTPIYG